MLTLGPLKKQIEIAEFFSKTQLKPNENSGCVVCKDSNEVLGFCLYDLTDKKMTVRYIEPISDIPLADGILRSTLHVSAEKSIMNVFYDDIALEEFFEKIGFIKDKNEKTLNIDKLFSSCSSCGK